jgi:hypothetical protein
MAPLVKVNKGGSGYTLFHEFTDGLLRGNDGSFYAIGYGGTILRLCPSETPYLILGTNDSQNARITIAGASGCQYQLQRSTNLQTWYVVTNVAMPTNGLYSYTENHFPASAVFYRAAWIP